MEVLWEDAFCRPYSGHMNGESMMRKRHLEILGYRVVQVSEAGKH